MANYLTTDTELESVANAIRTKGGTSESLSYPSGFVSAIQNIPSGGGGGVLTEKHVNFIDYDGTLLYSYTADEAQALSALPANPSHTGLIAQGWNWTLADIKSRLATGPIFVGQMYTTTSGSTEIDIEIDESVVNTELYIKFAYSDPNYTEGNSHITIDWGDGDTTHNSGKGSITSISRWDHIYENTGTYTISLSATSGASLRLSNYNNYNNAGLFWSSTTWVANEHNAPLFSRLAKAVRVGNNCDLGNRAFRFCTSLKYVTFPNTITQNKTYIDSSMFQYCYSLESITFPSGITEVKENVFINCPSLKIISFPNSVTTYGSSLYEVIFENCVSLKNILYGAGSTIIRATQCRYLYSLKYINIPNTIETIGNNAFAYSSNLLEAILPNTITTFGNNVFNNCLSLKKVVLPNQLTELPASTFSACHSLTDVTLPSTLTTISNNAFNNCYSLRHITIPSSVITIGTTAFGGCYSLQEVIIQGQLLTIGSSAFSDCYNLKSITIPSSVTSIDSNAFYNCTLCKEYHFLPTSPPALGSSVFYNIPSDCVIYVPYSSDGSILETYKTANNWSTYATYMQEEPQS